MSKICDSEKHIESDLSKSSIDTHYSSEIKACVHANTCTKK